MRKAFEKLRQYGLIYKQQSKGLIARKLLYLNFLC